MFISSYSVLKGCIDSWFYTVNNILLITIINQGNDSIYHFSALEVNYI